MVLSLWVLVRVKEVNRSQREALEGVPIGYIGLLSETILPGLFPWLIMRR